MLSQQRNSTGVVNKEDGKGIMQDHSYLPINSSFLPRVDNRAVLDGDVRGRKESLIVFIME